MKVFFDFETRSGCELGDCGTYVYSKDPTTDAICMAWAVDDGPVKIWLPLEGDGPPTEVLDCVKSGAEMVAHNAAFERLIWRNVCVKKYGWPELDDEQLFCSMVMSYSMGMMGALENAATCVGLPVQKDMKGNRVMLQLAKPRSVDQKTGEITWWEKTDSTPKLDIAAKYQMVYDYCMQDVNVQRELYKRLLPLDLAERKTWLLDQKINDRGIWVDQRAAANAIELSGIESRRLNEKISELTERDVSSCNAHAALKKWVNAQGVETESVDKSSVLDLLADESLPVHVREVLEIRQSAAKSSINKINRMLSGLDGGRVKGNFQYYGAASTGRWSGRGIQLQNLQRPSLKQKDIESILSMLGESI